MNSGVGGQISGFTVSVSDIDGKIKKSVNAVLDAWSETIRGENEEAEDTAIVLQVGTRANQAIKIGLTDMRAQALGLQGTDGSTLNVSNQQNANAAINVLDTAIQKALDQQTSIGAIESRLTYTSTNLTTAIENVMASESTLRDVDMAQAITEYTRNNILSQSSQAMLAQANQNSSQVLSLLR
ncbi:flagellin [Schwartzia succinivorans]|nr:flagellin [Schwartzia succinivorans]